MTLSSPLPHETVAVLPFPDDTSATTPTALILNASNQLAEQPRKVRVDLTIQQKNNLCASIDAGKSVSVAARDYKVEVSTVHRVYRKKEDWHKFTQLGFGKLLQYHPPRANKE